jgi:hypothetical protein
MHALPEQGFQDTASGEEASIESCHVLMVSSVVHDLLIRRGLLILSRGGTGLMSRGVECTRSMQLMPRPIVAKSFDAHSALRATWRLGHKAMSM